MPRLFTAISLPDALAKALPKPGPAPRGCRLRPAPPEQTHLTLRFFGGVSGTLMEALVRELGKISRKSFSLKISGAGFFPGPKRPSVLWLGVEKSPELLALHAETEDRAEAAGAPREGRDYVPHLTLARIKTERSLPPEAAAGLLAPLKDFSAEPFTAGEFALFSSVLTGGGAVHRKEFVFKLK
jgi:2'-5' RNA ligase